MVFSYVSQMIEKLIFNSNKIVNKYFKIDVENLDVDLNRF